MAGFISERHIFVATVGAVTSYDGRLHQPSIGAEGYDIFSCVKKPLKNTVASIKNIMALWSYFYQNYHKTQMFFQKLRRRVVNSLIDFVAFPPGRPFILVASIRKGLFWPWIS